MSDCLTRRNATKGFLTALGGGLILDRKGSAFGAQKRDLPQESIRTQICVIGAGSGGTGAALAAARAGADVVLLER